MTENLVSTPARGPAEHAVRDQIIEAANDCFARYGYAKTTVADLAREIGFSKAYIYRFFESKQAIGEAICSARLERIVREARIAVAEGESATDRFRRFFKSITGLSVELFFDDRKIYEIAASAASENWASARAYKDTLRSMIAEIVREGREAGEFERKTPLDETCRAIVYAMMPFVDPLHLERNLDLLPDAQTELTGLILRSLAP
ncbi:TetR/AcrR family transcriptional regulator [Sphingomonas sp. HT-1]|uniref:TetR/AcrR family transcriptional regulator n=1 Tax=unclassified Sphingomonas TaxID=196159 RepID=UPI0002EE0E71|nr:MULTISPECIES: TetR/AcrR family transcriptional regulator [unclassified Sphingomonas]KTF68268.1 AcrR family transcriptional regulator [Sphingomonas sp. WG]